MTREPEGITWAERVANLRKALGREPTLNELLSVVRLHNMTPVERRALREEFPTIAQQEIAVSIRVRHDPTHH